MAVILTFYVANVLNELVVVIDQLLISNELLRVLRILVEVCKVDVLLPCVMHFVLLGPCGGARLVVNLLGYLLLGVGLLLCIDISLGRSQL